MRGLMQRAGLIVVVAAVLGACGGSGGTNNNGIITIAKAPVANGDAQSATVGSVLPVDLKVLVTEDGNPKQGQTITFAAAGGGVNPLSSVSDANGIAKTTWTLGTVSGAQTVTASLRAAIGSPLTFTGTANADTPQSMAKVAGDFQTAASGDPFPVSLSVQVRDQFGNGVPGVSVTWAVVSGSVTTDATGSATNSQGVAGMPVTAGITPGPAQVRATSPSVIGTQLNFSLTVTPAARVVNASGAGAGVAFTSVTNGTVNPAVDTIPVGGAIKWVQVTGGHTVLSTGAPSFVGTNVQLTPTGFTVVFNTVGAYQYECGIHGPSMTGTVVVQ